jgi:hypothetical protein
VPRAKFWGVDVDCAQPKAKIVHALIDNPKTKLKPPAELAPKKPAAKAKKKGARRS